MLAVIRIRDRLDIVGKTVNAANIFRRTSSLSIDTARVYDSRLGFRHLFKDDIMMPTVSKVQVSHFWRGVATNTLMYNFAGFRPR